MASAQVNTGTNRYDFRQGHHPEGTGKFYMGREIALVMGHEAAAWLERPERNLEEHTEQLVQELKLTPGQVVADIGAGTGYFTQRLAQNVGARGRVLAVDIQPEMIYLLTDKMRALGISNVTAVLGSAIDPRLARDSVDLVLMVDVYHEFDHPFEMMQRICEALKPGGRVAFVEYRLEDPRVPIKRLHKMSEEHLKKEMAVLPLEWIETDRVLPWQNIFVFRRKN